MEKQELKPGMTVSMSLASLYHETPHENEIAELVYGYIAKSSDGEADYYDLFECGDIKLMDGESAELVSDCNGYFLFACMDTGVKFQLTYDEAQIAVFG